MHLKGKAKADKLLAPQVAANADMAGRSVSNFLKW